MIKPLDKGSVSESIDTWELKELIKLRYFRIIKWTSIEYDDFTSCNKNTSGGERFLYDYVFFVCQINSSIDAFQMFVKLGAQTISYT